MGKKDGRERKKIKRAGCTKKKKKKGKGSKSEREVEEYEREIKKGI